MVCPYCSSETSVINSRHQKRSNQVWRRRQCQKCRATFTTHEIIHLPTVFIVKTNRGEIAFTPDILYREIFSALRGHQRSYEAAQELTATITQRTLKKASGGLILAQDISAEAAGVLKRFDKQAYLRFVAEHPSLQ